MAIEEVDNITDEDLDRILEEIESSTGDDSHPGSEEDNDEQENNEVDDDEQDDDNEYDDEDSESDESDEADEADENDENNSDNIDTDTDPGSEDQQDIDYKNEYQKLLDESERYRKFYEEATSEFIANGKPMRGFDDPKKIIQAQQMAAGFSQKMRSIKEYKPFLKPLKESGVLENPDKFNLIINAMNGDRGAITQILKQAEIDPLEIDLEDQDNYTPKNVIASDIELALDEVIDNAEQYGVRDQVEKVIAEEWDDTSVYELLSDPQNSVDLVNHLSTGVYDLVMDRIAEKKITDPYGIFSKKPAIEQYREAANELENEYLNFLENQQGELQANQQTPYSQNAQQFSEAEIQAEMEKIRLEQEYRKKVEEKNNEVDRNRKRAASVSKKKPASKRKTKKVYDVSELSDEEFDKIVDSFLFN